MTCNSSCSLTDNKTSFQLYENTEVGEQKVVENPVVPISSTESFFCTVKDHHDLLSKEVCEYELYCRIIILIKRERTVLFFNICLFRNILYCNLNNYFNLSFSRIQVLMVATAGVWIMTAGESVAWKVHQWTSPANTHILNINSHWLNAGIKWR